MHHIVSDGWSRAVLYRELSALYGAFIKGEASPLAELPIQYADFAEWQQEYLQGELLEKLIAYWKKQMAGSPTLLELPTDHPRPPLQSHRGECVHVRLPAELIAALKKVSAAGEIVEVKNDGEDGKQD